MDHGLISYLRRIQELEGILYTYEKLIGQIRWAQGNVSTEAHQVRCYQYGDTIPPENDPIRKTPNQIQKAYEDSQRSITTANGRVFNAVISPPNVISDDYNVPDNSPTVPPTPMKPTSCYDHIMISTIPVSVIALVISLVSVFRYGTGFLGGVKYFGLCFAVGVILSAVLYPLRREKYRKSAESWNEKKMADYRAVVDARNAILNQEHAYLSQSNASIAEMERLASQVRAKLNGLYEQNIVHPKYRNLIAVSQMIEYLETGRCETLTGIGGAYNLFEEEMQKDRIISKLHLIAERLEQIRQRQYGLYQMTTRTEGYVTELRAELTEMGTELFRTPAVVKRVNDQVIRFLQDK